MESFGAPSLFLNRFNGRPNQLDPDHYPGRGMSFWNVDGFLWVCRVVFSVLPTLCRVTHHNGILTLAVTNKETSLKARGIHLNCLLINTKERSRGATNKSTDGLPSESLLPDGHKLWYILTTCVDTETIIFFLFKQHEYSVPGWFIEPCCKNLRFLLFFSSDFSSFSGCRVSRFFRLLSFSRLSWSGSDNIAHMGL